MKYEMGVCIDKQCRLAGEDAYGQNPNILKVSHHSYLCGEGRKVVLRSAKSVTALEGVTYLSSS